MAPFKDGFGAQSQAKRADHLENCAKLMPKQALLLRYGHSCFHGCSQFRIAGDSPALDSTIDGSLSIRRELWTVA